MAKETPTKQSLPKRALIAIHSLILAALFVYNFVFFYLMMQQLNRDNDLAIRYLVFFLIGFALFMVYVLVIFIRKARKRKVRGEPPPYDGVS